MKFDELPNLKFHHSAPKFYHKLFSIFEYNILVMKMNGQSYYVDIILDNKDT